MSAAVTVPCLPRWNWHYLGMISEERLCWVSSLNTPACRSPWHWLSYLSYCGRNCKTFICPRETGRSSGTIPSALLTVVRTDAGVPWSDASPLLLQPVKVLLQTPSVTLNWSIRTGPFDFCGGMYVFPSPIAVVTFSLSSTFVRRRFGGAVPVTHRQYVRGGDLPTWWGRRSGGGGGGTWGAEDALWVDCCIIIIIIRSARPLLTTLVLHPPSTICREKKSVLIILLRQNSPSRKNIKIHTQMIMKDHSFPHPLNTTVKKRKSIHWSWVRGICRACLDF